MTRKLNRICHSNSGENVVKVKTPSLGRGEVFSGVRGSRLERRMRAVPKENPEGEEGTTAADISSR